MNSLDLTPTWAGLLPALFAMLESGTGEGPAFARQELSRLAAFADSANAAAKEERAKEELAAQRGRGLAADSLAEALAMARSALAAFPPADLERQKGGAAWRDTSKDLRAALAELVAAFSSSPSSN